jgi:uncharacterized protein YfdQ (DUF2303 family)
METCDVKEAFQAGLNQGEVRDELEVPFVLVPNGTNIQSLELFMAAPVRKRGSLTFSDVQSFIHYVNKHKVEGSTALFATVMEHGAVLSAVFDHHSSGAEGSPGWRAHTARYATQPTVEWKRWTAANKVQMGQKQFAEFLEENLTNIVSPAGAVVLEVARRLEAKTSVNFVSGVRLNNGDTQLVYEETTDAKAGEKGDLAIPEEFKIGLELFEGSAAYEVRARLRYRIEAKALKLWFELVNPHLIVKDAVKELVAAVRAETGLTALMGDPGN